MLNKLTLIGRVGQTPECKEVNGTEVAEFSIATSESWKNKDGEKQEKTEWTSVVCWRGLAGVVKNYVKKGDLIYVEGTKETQKWEKDGETKSKVILQCRDMKMLGKNTSQSSGTKDAPPSDTPQDDLPF